MRISQCTFLLLILAFGEIAHAQPATPPAVHVEAIGTHDVSSDSVGATPGDFRVDEGGAASYSLPIISLPGTAGLSPKLSLDYSARGSVGALGTGFVLSGQSAITQCKKTVEAGDGAGPHPGVDYSDPTNIAHCLDGQRLFSLIDPFCPVLEDIGDKAIAFRTELDPATRVCAYVPTDGGFGLWLVFPKDGTMRRYGYAGNSSLRPNDGNGIARTSNYVVQAMDRIADATGNTVDFVYTGNVATGELLLDEVRYTGKVANRLNMSAPYTRAHFARTAMLYQPMPLDSQRVDFSGGSRMALTKRLVEINVYGPANNGANPNLEVHARRYALSYGLATTGSRMSRLTAVLECAPGVSSASDVCYPPSRFSWNSSADNDFPEGFNAPASLGDYSSQLSIAADLRTADVNGDGRQDLVFLRDRHCAIAGPDRVFNAQDPNRFQLMVATSNGSGLNSPVATTVYLSRKPPNNTQQQFSYTNCNNNQPSLVRLEERDASNVLVRTSPLFWQLSWHLFDFSGDGRDDVIVQRDKIGTSGPVFGLFVHATNVSASSSCFLCAVTDLGVDSGEDRDYNLTDFTGDGLPDLLFGPFPALRMIVLERALADSTNPNNLAYRFEQTLLGDQLVTRVRTVTQVGFDPNVELSFGPPDNASNRVARIGDIDGDGAQDLVLKAFKIQSGFVCQLGSNACVPCGGASQPACNSVRACTPGPNACVMRQASLFEESPTRFLTAAQQAGAIEASTGTNEVSYWITARLRRQANGDFALFADTCSAGGATTSCNDDPTLESATLTDLNGDSYADWWMQRKHSSSTQSDPVDDFRYRLNTGGGANRMLAEESAGLTLKRRFSAQLQLLDITGDKRTDLIYQCERNNFSLGASCPGGVSASDGSFPMRTKIWNAGGFFLDRPAATGSLTTLGNQNPDEFLSLGMDLRGEGTPSFLRYRANASASNNLYVLSSNLRFGGNDFIVKFANGFNVEHIVSYAPLVSKFTYEREFDGPRKNYGRGSTVFDVFSPLWAVREARSSSPGCLANASTCTTDSVTQAATSVIRYSYRGARVQTGGRGFLGFASIRTEDIQNILVTTTDYRQDYPYIGRASRTTVERRSALIPDNTCITNPLDPVCFREPPDDCGGGICPVSERSAQRGLMQQQPERFAPLDNPINCEFDAPLVGVITDSTSCFTSEPLFAPAVRKPIAVYSNSAQEKRYDLTTLAQTHRIESLMTMDAQANMTFQQSTTFDASDVQVEAKGQINFYGCTEAPIVLVKNVGCQSTPNPDSERVRLGRLSLTSAYSIRNGVTKERRSSFEYDPITLLLHAEVQGLYNYGGIVNPNNPEPPLSAKAHMHQRTDFVLDADGNRTLSVTCNVSNYADRNACLNLSQFQQQQWPTDPTRIQRYTRMEYDSLGRFMQGSKSPYYSATNAAGADAYNERSGVNAAGTALNRNVYGDPLGALTAHNVYAEKAYGPMGREYFARAATGAFSRSTYAWCVDASNPAIPSNAPRANCPSGALYRVESNTSEGNQNARFIAPQTFAYFDKLGRNILSTTRLYQSTAADVNNVSRWSSSYTRYDVLGRVKSKSEPFISKDPLAGQNLHRAGDPQIAGSVAETRTNYDALGRSTSVQLPNEAYNLGLSVSSATFDRMQTTSFNPRSNRMIMDKNGLAEAVKATDANNFAVNYRYEANGNMDQVTRTPSDGSNAGQAITTSIVYDVLGRKTSMTDPDKGTLKYTYNALGELLKQVDARGQAQSLFYDALGRLIERRETRVVGRSIRAEPTAKWTYDDSVLIGTSQKALGLLHFERMEYDLLSGPGQFDRSYSYDRFGRSIGIATNIDGTLYYQRTTYDQYGRVFQSFDASTSASSPRGQLQIYSDDGYPVGVREAANGMDGQFYSEVLALTARQQVWRERYHGSDNLVSERTFENNTGRLAAITTGVNGSLQKWNYRWDKNGSLSERADTTNGADFKEVFTYDELDRLTKVTQTRSNGFTTNVDTLTLAYDQLGNIISKTGEGVSNLGSYQYNGGNGCLQLGEPGAAGPHAVSNVNGKTYCYDFNGNNTAVLKNDVVIRQIRYTGYDLAETVIRDEVTAKGAVRAQVSFRYGTDRSMIKRVDSTISGVQNKTTYYVGNVEFIREGITSSTKRYIGGYLVITNVGNNPAVFDYLLRDSLGSIDTIASETGVLKSRQSFNAHGQRRQAAQPGVTASWNTLSLFQASLFNTSTTTQGYTGHEQLDQVGLVHMNARLYDPELGRFIQADDFVEPEATQGLNRYSYVLNNPMSATDPSGNFSLRQALGAVVGIAAAIFSGGLFAANALWSSFFVATAGGFASAAIATGSLKAGLWGALSAAAFWGIGTAFSKTVTELIPRSPGVEIVTRRVASGSVVAKVAAHAVAGGTLTQLQGGKFGHGFIAAGFSQALSPAVGQIGGKGFGAVLSRTAVSAAIGGTASKLSGGSFANGAQTGAFQELFNDSVHQLMKPGPDWLGGSGPSDVRNFPLGFETDQFATPWVDMAKAELGVAENSAKGEHNERIIEYHGTTGGFKTDETPWCSSFMNWTMQASGFSKTGSALASSWANYGFVLDEPVFGAIAVINWGGGRGHVGIVVGQNASGAIVLLGGNQGTPGFVNYTAFGRSLISQYRYPNNMRAPGYLPQVSTTTTGSLETTR
jgi:uncharacterized protein (TIGR02594 family)